MTDFWKLLVDQLVVWLIAHFGSIFGEFFRRILGEAAKDRPDPYIIKAGVSNIKAAPDELKNALLDAITELVTDAFARFPRIAKIAVVFVQNMAGKYLDNLWDKFFAARIQAGEVLAWANVKFTLPKTAAAVADPAPVSQTDVAACRQEAGV